MFKKEIKAPELHQLYTFKKDYAMAGHEKIITFRAPFIDFAIKGRRFSK
jgi:hypothetical protein